MSLIEEALRKQREETKQGQSAPMKLSMPPAPPPPPPLPQEDTENGEAPASRRIWPLLAGIVGVSLILIVGIALLLFFGVKDWRAKPAVKANTPIVTNSAPTALLKVKPDFVATQMRQTVETPAKPALPQPDTNPAPMAVMAPSSTGEEPRVIKIGGTNPLTETPASEKVQTILWPRLTVSGLIGTSQGSKGAAIINGQMLGPGNVIEGVKVIAVDKQGVRLSFGGETRTLTVGGTTE